MQEQLIDHRKIADWGIRMFVKTGVPVADAATIVNALVKTSLSGR